MIELFALPGKWLSWLLAAGCFFVITATLTFGLFALSMGIFGPALGFVIALVIFIKYEFGR
jgi:hypothetical protein